MVTKRSSPRSHFCSNFVGKVRPSSADHPRDVGSGDRELAAENTEQKREITGLLPRKGSHGSEEVGKGADENNLIGDSPEA